MEIDLKQQFKRQLPPKKEKSDRIKHLAMKALAGFFIIMVMLTTLSRTASAMTTPQVKVSTLKPGRIEQKVEATGSLRPKDEESMEVGSGLTVKEVYIEEGDRVKAGDALIELDSKELQQKVEDAKTELKKLQLRFQEMGLNEDFSSASTPTEKVLEKIKRLEEDKLVLEEKEDTKVIRQKEKVGQAEAFLQEAMKNLEAFKEKDLEEQINKVEKEIKQLEYALTEAKKNLDNEKYEKEKAIARAEKTLQDAKEQLWLTNGDATMALQNYERAKMEYEFTKSDWERKVKEAENKVKEAENKVEEAKLSLEKLQKGDRDESLLKQEEEKVKLAQKGVEEANGFLEDLLVAKEEALKEVDRQIEDANKELVVAEKEEANGDLKEQQEAKKEAIQAQLMQLDIDAKQKEIGRIESIIQQGGKLVAPTDGIVLDIKVQRGNTTAGGELLTFVGDESEYIFEVEVGKEEGEYLQIGDTVEVYLEGDKTPLEDTVIQNIIHLSGDKSGKKKISILVPKGKSGMQATMKATKESEKYNFVLPIEALRQDNAGYYVLVARKKMTTLGEDWVAERVEVMQQDKNTSSIAVQGAFSSEDQVIIQSNKPIVAGDRIRLIEQ